MLVFSSFSLASLSSQWDIFHTFLTLLRKTCIMHYVTLEYTLVLSCAHYPRRLLAQTEVWHPWRRHLTKINPGLAAREEHAPRGGRGTPGALWRFWMAQAAARWAHEWGERGWMKNATTAAAGVGAPGRGRRWRRRHRSATGGAWATGAGPRRANQLAAWQRHRCAYKTRPFALPRSRHQQVAS